jgi:hypothetical protein
MITRRGEHCRVPIEAGCRPEVGLLAELVALHISAHPAGCLAFQEKLNGAMARGLLGGVEINA